MSACPTCGKDVDPIRSRFVGVRGGKVVPFCSVECRDAPASAPKAEARPAEPAKKTPTPPAGVAAGKATPTRGVPKSPVPMLDSAPVIEVTRETASGSVKKVELAPAPSLKAAPDPKAAPTPGKAPELKVAPEPKATKTPDAKDGKADAKDARPEAKDTRKPEAGDAKDAKDTRADAKDTKADAKDTKADAKDTKADAKDAKDTKADAKVDDKREAKPKEALAAAKVAAGAELEIAAKTPEKRDATGARTSEGKDNAAVSGEKTNDDPLVESGKHKAKKKNERDRRESQDARGAWPWIDEEPAENVHAADGGEDDDRRSGMKKVTLWLLVLAVLAGGGIVVYKYVIKKGDKKPVATAPGSGSGSAMLPQQQQPPPKPPAPPSGATLEANRKAALTRATDILRGHLASNSDRVRRMAAAALARTGDNGAKEALFKALTDETAELPRLDLAYALARAGDVRGTDAIAAYLGSERRDVRLEAGRQLIMLGDKRGPAALAGWLEVPQHRLSVAEQLARTGDAAAISVLDALRKDDKASPDDRARAVVALGHAGKAEVAEDLKKLLPDPRFNPFAAAALASLKDESARATLVKQLDVPSLRVDAARSLRRLGGEVDTRLPPLVTALESAKDIEQIRIAEAIVLLAGPPAWSERA